MALGDIIRVNIDDSKTTTKTFIYPIIYTIGYDDFVLASKSSQVYSNIETEDEQKRNVLVLFIPHIFLLISISLFLTYYVAVTTILNDNTLPFIKIEGKTMSFATANDIKDEFSYLTDFEEEDVLYLNLDGERITISKASLDLSINTDEIIEYGKGKNLTNTFGGIIGIAESKDFDVNLDMNLDPVIVKLPIVSSNTNNVEIRDGKLLNCESNTFDFELDANNHRNKIQNSIKNNDNTVSLELDDIVGDEKNIRLINLCKNLNTELTEFENLFTDSQINDPQIIKASNYFESEVIGDSIVWNIKDKDLLLKTLNQYKIENDKEVDQGEYFEDEKSIYVYKWFKSGRSLDVDKSLEPIALWINNPSEELPFVYSKIQANAELTGKEVKDFAQVLGVGETRMHLVYDNRIGQAQNVITGLEEINNMLLEPGQEFSYFNAIGAHGPENTYTKGDKLIAMGICTSVTTLFRSVLDSGLPITQRENYGEYVYKYQWNPSTSDELTAHLVDATFYAAPGSIIDFKFVNDFNEPIIIRTVIEYDDLGYQYHTIEMRGSSELSRRQVEYLNWSITDYVSPVKFNSTFDRIVKDEDAILFTDSYFSDYKWGY
ncbi:MAG: VanW family protein [Candidatus Dojkabacteria bacterium]|nr:VanW family protein [Candidatus Dojkabacteria bacterium]MDQ7021609.1 VanW family protein [Candidatus Dojkabacteria bacterium]